MKRYPSIKQFRNIIHDVRMHHDFKGIDEQTADAVYQHTEDYPILKFKGTVKLHGTNAAIVKYKDRIEYQSRERVLSLDHDNADFMLAMSNNSFIEEFDYLEFEDYIAVYGEWYGGNIQSINKLPKMFVIFDIKIDNKWIDIDTLSIDWKWFNHKSIFNIYQFPNYEVEIDFNNPEAIQNKLIDLTIKVEEECPVGAYFGVKIIGEGIVFTSINNPNLKFKSKGTKHSSSKVKILNSVNTEEIENIKDFIEYSVTESRLNQGLSYLKENNLKIDQKNTGEFLKWIFKDILKEEKDTIIKNQINLKKANSLIAIKAKVWFFKNF